MTYVPPTNSAPPDSTHFAIEIIAFDKDANPIARFRLGPAAAKVIETYMKSAEGAKAIEEATGMDNQT